MSDSAFVAAAYAIVLGGLSLYIVSISRRLRAARRMAEALERARHHTLQGVPGEVPATPAGKPSEVRR